MNRLRVLPVVAGCVLVAAGWTQAQEPAADLQPLDRFVGTWEKKVTVHQAKWTPEEQTKTGTHTAQWVLGKHHLYEAGSDSDGVKYLALYSYDLTTKDLRRTYFQSNGSPPLQMAGAWDAKSESLVLKSPISDKIEIVATYHFVNADTFEFSFVAKDDEGEAYIKVTGVGKRVAAGTK